MKALWNNQIIAESNETIMIEGNHYFPPASLKMEYFIKNDFHTTCPWKGLAYYYNIDVNSKLNVNGAWYYPEPKPNSIPIVMQQNNNDIDFSSYVAFWRGVEVVS